MSTIKQRLLEAIPVPGGFANDRSPIAELENTLLFLENRLTLNSFTLTIPQKPSAS
jgi:hypothetical protein